MTVSTLYEIGTPASFNSLAGWEAGLKFYSNVSGSITALRYYKNTGGAGTITGRVWNSSGTLLASVVFTGETASGWQEQALATPLAITSGTNYVVSRNITDKLAISASVLSGTVPTANSTNQLFLPIKPGVFKSSGAGSFPDGGGTNNDYYAVSLRFDDGAGGSSATLSPTSIAANSTGNTVVFTGSGTSYTPGTPGSPTFTLSGGTGASITAQTVTSATSATLTISAGSVTGTLVVSDGTNTANLTVSSAALVAGTVALTSRSTTPSGTFSRSVSTGGTGTVTSQFQVSTVSGSGYTNITGGTGSTVTYTAPSPGIYYFRCAYTDSSATPVTVYSSEISTVLATDSIFVGFIGDSITAGTVSGSPPPPTTMANVLESFANTFRIVAFSNRGVSGSYTTQWVVGQTNYSSAITAFNTASSGFTKKYVLIMLGTNDCNTTYNISQATYKANLLNLCNGLLASGYIPVLNYQPFPTDNPTHNVSLLLQYQTAINSLVNGVSILQGDTLIYQHILQNPSLLTDTIHPNQTGANMLGGFWAGALWRLVYSTKIVAKRIIKVG